MHASKDSTSSLSICVHSVEHADVINNIHSIKSIQYNYGETERERERFRLQMKFYYRLDEAI